MHLPSQRHLFELPTDVTYLNCAYMSPQLRGVREAGEAALRLKAEPWRIRPEDFFTGSEELRGLFAGLVVPSPLSRVDKGGFALCPFNFALF